MTAHEGRPAADRGSVKARRRECDAEGDGFLRETPTVSVVVPAPEVTMEVHAACRTLRRYFRARGTLFEILIVCDARSTHAGSLPDDGDEGHCRLLQHPYRAGKGSAVRYGLEASTGRYVMVTDADLPVRERYWDQVLCACERHEVIACVRPWRVRTRGRPLVRRVLSLAHLFLVRALFPGLPNDTQCGCKCYKAAAAATLASDVKVAGGMYELALLGSALRRGYRVMTIAVDSYRSAGSRVDVSRVLLRDLLDVLRIRFTQSARESATAPR